MALKLMHITNRPDAAQIPESAGVDRIFVGLQYIGKSKHLGGMDTVQNHHTIDDIGLVQKIAGSLEMSGAEKQRG